MQIQITIWSENRGEGFYKETRWFYSIHEDGRQEFNSMPYWFETREYAWANANARLQVKEKMRQG